MATVPLIDDESSGFLLPNGKSVPIRPRIAWPALLFVVAMLLPTDTSVMLGGLRLSGYRVLLIVLFPIAVGKVYFGRRVGPRIIDWLILGNAIWVFLALAKNHDVGRAIEGGGIYLVEGVGAYCLARAFIRTPSEYFGTVRCVMVLIVLVLPFAVVESVTGIHVMRLAFSGGRFSSDINTRYGLHRAFGPFDHPILCGVILRQCTVNGAICLRKREPVFFRGDLSGLCHSIHSDDISFFRCNYNLDRAAGSNDLGTLHAMDRSSLGASDVHRLHCVCFC